MNIGIVCEYNPFHNGHMYQIDQIRKEFGAETNIVALMSGNFVQRGGVAIADKGLRAKCAVLSGANLVLELPFPFSMSSAEFFARSSIHVFNELGCIDYISFGSESGSVEDLWVIARQMLTEDFDNQLSLLMNNPKTKKLGYAALCELALGRMESEANETVSLTPNNILAIEYIKALITSKSSIKPHTIKRLFNSISDETFVPGIIQSATAIRKSIECKDISALEYVPNITKNILLEAISTGDFPCDNEKISPAVIASLRLDLPSYLDDIQDTNGGLYNRLTDLSFKTNSLEELVCAAESKNFTKARIRRALFYSLMGVTSSHLKEMPAYTQVLAFDQYGRALLKKIGKTSSFPILTKPSDTSVLSDFALRQKVFSDRADSVFQMTKPMPKDGNDSLRYTPFVKY